MDVFDRMQQAAHEGGEQKQLTFQERIVKQLMRRANIQFSVGLLKSQAREKYNNDSLGFDWFHSEYPTFPLQLMAQKMPYTHQVTLADIYGKGRFKQLNWWREYEAQVSLYGIDLQRDRAVLFFNLPKAKDAFLMTLHNQPVQANFISDAEQRQDEPWPRTTFPMGRSGIVAVLESFESFLQTVGTDWAEV